MLDLGMELTPKRLELLREMVPGLRRVFLAYAANSQFSVTEATAYREAAHRLSLDLVERPVRSQEEARAALAAIKRGDVQGLMAPQEMTWNIPGFTHAAAARLKLPSMWVDRKSVV